MYFIFQCSVSLGVAQSLERGNWQRKTGGGRKRGRGEGFKVTKEGGDNKIKLHHRQEVGSQQVHNDAGRFLGQSRGTRALTRSTPSSWLPTS